MSSLRFEALSLPGAYLIDSLPATDPRGSFARLWCAAANAEHGLPSTLAQISHSVNPQLHTLRGMHYQTSPYEESKWVRCVSGEIYDVLIDLRPQSTTFGRWQGIHLTAERLNQVFIPPGVAHGFLTLMPETVVLYSISEFYQPGAARGVRWNDPAFAIQWPAIPQVISPRDAEYPLWPRSSAGSPCPLHHSST